MRRRDVFELLLLGAIWGASFLFMCLGAADFGALALSLLRVAGASLLLVPLLLWRGDGPALRRHWRAIAVVGLINSALPFVLFALAALVLGTGLMAVFNATAPIWGAFFAWIWLGERLDRARLLGLAIGVAGVVGLAWGKAGLQVGAALMLALVCTGLAYVLFFRLIAHAGATNAISVTLLIPGFAMLWGWLIMGETPTPAMLLGCAVILLGTALSTGVLKLSPPTPQQKSREG